MRHVVHQFLSHPSLLQLPGGGADLTLSELQGLAARQQVAMETQQQALVARETRLKYLQQQEARHRQLASEQARLQRMRERVEAQELKLKKLRALRGQVEQYKASNGNLSELCVYVCVFVRNGRGEDEGEGGGPGTQAEEAEGVEGPGGTVQGQQRKPQ